MNDRKRSKIKKQNIIEDVLENELDLNASLGPEKNQLTESNQQTSESQERRALLNHIESLQMKLEF